MSNNQLTEEEQIALEKYQKKKEQDAKRQRTYYAKNKDKILQKRKASALQKKETLNSALSKLAISTPVEETVNENIELQIEEEKEEPNIQPTTKKSNYTAEDIVNLIKNDKTIIKPNTRKTYISSIRRAFNLSKCDDLKNCLNSYKKMIDNIENAKKYTTNSIKQTLQTILFVNDKYQLFKNMFSDKKATELKKHFGTAFEKSKDNSRNELEEKQQTEEFPSFAEYLSKVKTQFGVKSKEYLVALLYSHFTVRDNFADLVIIATQKEDDGKSNFLLKTRTNTLKFIINDFKTKNKYQKLQFTVPKGELKTLLNSWINDKRLAYGDVLFKGKLTTFVSKLNKKLGYNDLGGVGIFRHMRVTELYENKNLSFEERNKLSQEMGHSLVIQKQYKRNLKVDGKAV